MTREDAVEILTTAREMYPGKSVIRDAFTLALSALRPVSREQVEKMKKEPVEGEYDELYAPTYKCPECGFENIGRGNFCRNCGCLHTDKAVEMTLERWKEAVDGESD